MNSQSAAQVNSPVNLGKGGFNGYCFLCGGWGHRSSDCATKSSGQGQGKGGNGKGNSLNSLAGTFGMSEQVSHDQVVTPSQPNQVNSMSHVGHHCCAGIQSGGSAGPKPCD